MAKNTNYVERLAEQARELISATSEVTEGHVKTARKQLAAALEDGLDAYGDLRKKALKRAKAVDESVHESPYVPIAVALIVGGFLAFLLTRRR